MCKEVTGKKKRRAPSVCVTAATDEIYSFIGWK